MRLSCQSQNLFLRTLFLVPVVQGLWEQARVLVYSLHRLCLMERKGSAHLPRRGHTAARSGPGASGSARLLSTCLTHAAHFAPQMFSCQALYVSKVMFICMGENPP